MTLWAATSTPRTERLRISNRSGYSNNVPVTKELGDGDDYGKRARPEHHGQGGAPLRPPDGLLRSGALHRWAGVDVSRGGGEGARDRGRERAQPARVPEGDVADGDRVQPGDAEAREAASRRAR